MAGGSDESGESDDAREAFALLRKAAVENVKIIPLIGAGLSVAAGVPPLPQITEHLVRVRLLLEYKSRGKPHLEYLRHRSWPGRHALNAELHAFKDRSPREEDLEGACARLVEEASSSNLRTLRKYLDEHLLEHQVPDPAEFLHLPASAKKNGEKPARFEQDWLTLLLYLADRQQGLVDAYFARLVRRRSCVTAHQFVAFLTKVFNWNPILTTNYDDLIESALRSQGINPVVFELARDVRDLGKLVMPHEELVRMSGQTSVIKLHGGTHGLCAGCDLNQPLSEDALKTYCKYLPDGAILLVLGYSARERRVMSLLDAWRRDPRGGGPIVWVYRTSKPEPRRDFPSLSKDVFRVQAEDPGLFLHELYQRILFTHPAGLQTYEALHYPPSTTYKKLSESGSEARAFPAPQHGPRRELISWYEDVSAEKRNAIRLWFSIREFPSLSSFLASLTEKLQTLDRGLPIAARPCTSDALDGPVSTQYCEHIRNALIRFPYRIAIDAYRPFLSGLSPEQRRDPKARSEEEHRRFDAFLVELVQLGIGESRFAVALDPADERRLESIGQALEVFPSRPGPVTLEPDGKELGEVLRKRAGTDPVSIALLEVASTFRRPRSLAGLAKVTAALLHERKVESTGTDADDPFTGAYYRRYEAIQRRIENFEDVGIFDRHHGGFYSIPSGARSSLAEEFSKDAERHRWLHERIADYYCAELYEHSKDPRAFFEYTYHRAAAASLAKAVGAMGDHRRHLDWLVATIEREADVLFAHGQAPRLLRLITHLLDQDWMLAALRPRLKRVRATMFRRATDYEKCRDDNFDLLRTTFDVKSADADTLLAEAHRLAKTAEGSDPSSLDIVTTLQIASDCLEVGASFNAQGWPYQGAGASDARAWLDVARDLARRVHGAPDASHDHRRQASVLMIRSLKSRIKLGPRTWAPWEWIRTDNVPESLEDEARGYYNEALDLLRSLGSMPRLRGLQCSVRCSYARHLYLGASFGKASVELNRAHAFGARAAGGESWDAVAEYHLHRAEYCLYRAYRTHASRQEGADEYDAFAPRWLLGAAATALREAEDALRRGDRSAASWLWFYIQRAWLNRDSLRMDLAASTEEKEEFLLAGLLAVAGALLNFNGKVVEAAVVKLWLDFREEWARAFGTSDDASWAELNRRAGLGPTFDRAEVRRYAPPGIKMVVQDGGAESEIENVSAFGVRIKERIGHVGDRKDVVFHLADRLTVAAEIRLCAHGGAAITRIGLEDRKNWDGWQVPLMPISRDRNERGRQHISS